MDAQEFPAPPDPETSVKHWKAQKTTEKLHAYWRRYAPEDMPYDEGETLILPLNREQRYEEVLQMIEKDPGNAENRGKGALSYTSFL